MQDVTLTYRQLPKLMYTDIEPIQVRAPELIIFNDALSRFLDLDITIWKDPAVLSGNELAPGSKPLAEAYIGHQFGYPAMLGDGRAHLLAEVIAEDKERYDIQLKGSGRTPYSRGGDGRAVLGPMLREYLISEAMHALGIPTSRSLAVVTTGENVRRDRLLPGAILTRVAKSHMRVGTFQYAAYRGVTKEVADYTIARHASACLNDENPYLCFYREVIERQAQLIAQWQAVGFIHGVMNTDNMTISGETIDYGPCAFMEIYRQDQVYSSIDHAGRYCYKNQPAIAKWNLLRLGETLLELVDRDEQTAIKKISDTLETFDQTFEASWLKIFSQKLGLEATKEARHTIESFLSLLETEKLDFTNAFLHLTKRPAEDLFQSDPGRRFQARWRETVASAVGLKNAQAVMKKVNPKVIPRNKLLQDALDQAEKGDLKPFFELLAVCLKPYEGDPPERFKAPTPSDSSFVTYCGT